MKIEGFRKEMHELRDEIMANNYFRLNIQEATIEAALEVFVEKAGGNMKTDSEIINRLERIKNSPYFVSCNEKKFNTTRKRRLH